MPGAPRILMLAGEASGDHHGAALARALRRHWPDARLEGLGGPAMEAAGVRLLAGLDRLAVMGLAEVVRHLPAFMDLLRRIECRLERADLVIPIDYPGFNLRVARAAHARGVPVLYYIAPQVWAWRPGRAARLARWADRIAVILPFEVDVLRRAGGDAHFVGHPLLDDYAADGDGKRAEADRSALRAAGLDPTRPILAVLPGSRRQELARHLECFARAARELMRRSGEGLQAALGRAPGVARAALEPAGLPVVDDTRALLRAARAALVKSGTSTLEAALADTPLVVGYRTHPLTYAVARRLVRLDSIALVNLVAGRRIVPELVQGDLTPSALADAAEPLLDAAAPARAAQL
ncbi:MAG: lipid-A-disaccharide synthase, partial [Gemmatimonadetes bacterium]